MDVSSQLVSKASIFIFYYLLFNFSLIKLIISFLKISLSNFIVCFFITLGSKLIFSNFSIALFNDKIVCFLKNNPVFQSITVSKAPPFLYAITGVQTDIASSGTNQKSSSGGNINAFALEYNSIFSFSEIFNLHSILFFDFVFNVLYNLLSVFVTSIIFFQFLLKLSTIKSNFL
jgi:hypothetical protein